MISVMMTRQTPAAISQARWRASIARIYCAFISGLLQKTGRVSLQSPAGAIG